MFAAGLVLVPDVARAYCVNELIGLAIQQDFPNGRVPVWIATGANSTVAHTGVSEVDIARMVIEVIARHNNAVAFPKLYFAGFASSELTPIGGMVATPYDGWENGIVIHGFDCGFLDPMNHTFNTTDYFCRADTRVSKACARLWDGDPISGTDNQYTVASIALVPGLCEYTAYPLEWSIDGSTADDLAEVILHEAGHTLGLKHSNLTQQECEAETGNVHGNDPGGNLGAMWHVTAGALEHARHWRRDDLDGLAALYGPFYPELELAHWRDDNFPEAPELGDVESLAGYPLGRTPSLGDAPPGQPQPLVLVDPTHRVQFARLAADGGVAEVPATIDGGALGETWGRPELAVGSRDGDPRVLVVWTAGELTTSNSMQTRWALRELAGGSWAIVGGFELSTTRVSAGFDPGTGQWLLVTFSIQAEPQVTILDFDANVISQEVALGVAAYDYSNPVCGHGRPGCTMLLAGSNAGGPSLGRVDFTVLADPADLAIDGVSFFAGNEEVYGALDLARAELGFARAIVGSHRVELDLDLNGLIDPPNPPTIDSRDWPVTIGAVVGEHRVGMALAVRCGNGVVQGDEECDDGNRTPGDGCDDQCSLEDGGGTGGTGGTSGTEDTDGGVLGPSEGCTCALDERRTSGLIWLFGLLGVSVWTRRS